MRAAFWLVGNRTTTLPLNLEKIVAKAMLLVCQSWPSITTMEEEVVDYC